MKSAELLYEFVLRFMVVVEYSSTLQGIAWGKAAPPPEGARFDISLKGSVDGPKLSGSWHGVEYANIRAD